MAIRRIKRIKTWKMKYAEMGATLFCESCFAYVYPEHSWHWPTSEFVPAQARLEGGLDYDEIEAEMENA